MVTKTTWNITREQASQLNLYPGYHITGILDYSTNTIVGNVAFPEGRTHKQKRALVRRKFGPHFRMHGIGLHEEYVDWACFGWLTNLGNVADRYSAAS